MKTIKLTRGLSANVDDEDFEYLNQFNWCAVRGDKKGNSYAARWDNGKNGKIVRMHRVLLGVDDPTVLVDHKNHDGLDNQKSNLRKCKRGDNNRNRTSRVNSASPYLGVSWNSKLKKWIAQIQSNKQKKYLGLYTTQIQAAKAYNDAAIELHKEFANLNII